MIEVIIKDNELQIYVNREKFHAWLTGKSTIPWDGDPNSSGESTSPNQDTGSSESKSEPEQGYRTEDGERKEFPNDGDGKDKSASTEVTPDVTTDEGNGDTSGEHVQDEDIGERPDAVDLFKPGPNGIGGTLQDDAKGKEKIKQLRDWMKEHKYNYRNFCLFLHGMKELAGWPLSTPLIGVTAKKEPTIFQVATRFHSYWLSAKDDIAEQYENFLMGQLNDMGITIQMVKDEFNGEEIDPRNLPKGIVVK